MSRLRRPWPASAAASFLGIGLGACAEPATEAECVRLLDHYTERLVVEETPAATAEQIAEKQAAARKLARSDSRFGFGDCPRRVSRGSYQCAIDAPSVDAIERCLVF